MLELSVAPALSSPDRCFSRSRGTALAALDDAWVARSATAHGSHVLNEECAAILRLVPELQVTSSRDICNKLAVDFDEDPAVIAEMLAPLWDRLIDLGLLTEHTCQAHS